MTEIDAKDKLLSEIKLRALSFHSSVGWYRRKHYMSSMVSVGLSAIITIISGWGVDTIYSIDSPQIVLVLGVLITVVSAWGAFFSPRESWHLYANTLNNLRALQAEIEFESSLKSDATVDEDNLRTYFSRYQNILKQHNEAWIEIRKSHAPSPNKKLQPTAGGGG